jgi:hypothetical protein
MRDTLYGSETLTSRIPLMAHRALSLPQGCNSLSSLPYSHENSARPQSQLHYRTRMTYDVQRVYVLKP